MHIVKSIFYVVIAISALSINADQGTRFLKNDAIALSVADVEKWGEASTSNVITDQEWQELEIDRLMNGSKEFEAVFTPSTVLGKVGIACLMNPLDNLEIIKARQSFIKLLVEDKHFHDQLESLLKKSAMYEKDFFTYWDKNNNLSKNRDQFYFSMPQPKTFFGLFKLPVMRDYFNKSSFALEYGMGKQFLEKLTVTGLFIGLQQVAQGVQDSFAYEKEFDYFSSFKNSFKSTLNEHNPFVHDQAFMDKLINQQPSAHTMVQWGSMCSGLSLGDRILCFKLPFSAAQLPFPLSDVLSFLFASGAVFLKDSVLYSILRYQIKDLYNTYQVMQNVHMRTVAAANYLKTVQRIEEIIKKDERVQNMLFVERCLSDTKCISKKMEQLLTLLQEKTFNKAGDSLYRRGNVLLADKLLQEIHGELTAFMRNIALIDAYISIAKFVSISQAKGLPICFVNYVDNNQPVELTMHEAWLPLLSCQNYICNSVSLGGAGAGSMILTGPNGCGKSTILKLLGLNAWFGLTCGIATAKEMHMTVFGSIKTSLQNDHKDSMADGLSTYMVANKAGERMKKYALQATNDQKALLLYGEPYRGTPDVETARKIMDFGKTIMQNAGHFIMALETHVFEPTTLENDFPALFTNGHMAIKESADGSFLRTFKLEKGPALWWFEDHYKRARFVDYVTVLCDKQESAQKAYIAQLKAQKDTGVNKQDTPKIGYIQVFLNKIKRCF